MGKIKQIQGREILDSRGNPTVEVAVELENGISATAAVPSGASTGTFEALELRDGDAKRYRGMGVLKAVDNVNNALQQALVGIDVQDQAQVDELMLEADGTENKVNLGANALLGVSLACARAAAMEKNVPLYSHIAEISQLGLEQFVLPVPMFNVLNGGMHSDSGLSVQEFKIVPNGIEAYSEQLRAGSEIFYALKKLLQENGHSTSVGDEGGFSPKLSSNEQALEFIVKAIADAGYEPGKEVSLGLDVAANSFFDLNTHNYRLEPEGLELKREELVGLYVDWVNKYHIISVEDGLSEEDWQGWAYMTETLAKKPMLAKIFGANDRGMMLIGDDLLVTNVKRLHKAIDEKACNSVLIKVNQIGTLSETIECIRLAKGHGMRTVISHRSGETTDDFISDLAVGTGADYMKSGSLSRGERICKYNRLLKIAEEIAR